jgi:lipopolysaccharide cholinephosphotransferase
MQISNEDLRRLQLTELNIAGEITDLCDKHDIGYVLLGGSALGARRHEGFIPWDDDMDMGMLRKDFDRFVEIARKELPDSLYLQYWLDDPHMGAPFAKVRLNNTRVLEATSKDTGGHKGISVDIFPFENVPDGFVEYPWKLQLKFWKRVVRRKGGYADRKLPTLHYLADLPVRVVARLISKASAKRKLHRLMTRYNESPADRVLAVGGAYDFRKDMLKRSWLSSRAPRRFEDRVLACPADLEAYLTHMYGDFMSLPPVEERHNKHTIVDLQFDVPDIHEQPRAWGRGLGGELLRVGTGRWSMLPELKNV